MSGSFNTLFDPSVVGAPQNTLAPQPTWADAWQFNAEHAQAELERQRAISEQRGLWGPDGPTPAGARDAAQQTAMGVIMGTTAPKPGFTAFHGSPYDFNAFDASKIGTGEGAQAYGHGMYLAENEGVARSYRDALKWKGTDWNDPQNVAGFWHNQFGGDADKAATYLQGSLKSQSTPEAKQAVQSAIDLLKSGEVGKGSANPGRMYEVGVNADPAHFLDWDKPLSEQHPKVREALANTEYLYHADRAGMSNPTGGQLVRDVIGDAPEGMTTLNKAGIPGIRYLDAGSRSAGTGSSNYVIFDPATMEILRKYGLAGLMAGGAGAAATQGGNGQ